MVFRRLIALYCVCALCFVYLSVQSGCTNPSTSGTETNKEKTFVDGFVIVDGGEHSGNCSDEECSIGLPSFCLDAQTLRVYDTKGSCHEAKGQCEYPFTDSKCPGLCRNGQCYAKDDFCASAKCDTPDKAKCLNNMTLRRFALPGTCKDKVCEYKTFDDPCPHGCKDGACLPDPCIGITCQTPPAPTCTDSKTLKNHYSPGVCKAGKCVYSTSNQTCPRGCAQGKCKVGTGFTPLQPFRFLDTRGSTRPTKAFTKCIPIGGKGGVPQNSRAVYINLVAVNPTSPGYLTAYPKGVSRPTSSSLNFRLGGPTANGAIVGLGTDGEICVYAHEPTDLIVDVYGYFDAQSDFVTKTPFRKVDTRTAGKKLADKSTTCYKITGTNNIPSSAKAIFANLVAVSANGPGHISAYPQGTKRPETSVLNYNADGPTANGAVLKIGDKGEICVYALTSTHFIMDITGYFADGTSFVAIGPHRKYDTRTVRKMTAGTAQCIQVTQWQGIPKTVKAVAINVASIQPEGPGHLTVYPSGIKRPDTSTLNYISGEVRANNAIVQPGSNGNICIYTSTTTHYVLDITGYWQQSSTGDPCAGVTCKSPPPAVCTGGKNLVSYASSGTCKNGVCLYTSSQKTCDYQCSGNKCISKPVTPPPTGVFHARTAWQTSSQPIQGPAMSLSSLEYITIHYNGGNLNLNGSDGKYQDTDFAQILRNMQNDYVRNRGYSLGYNSAVAPDGDEWEIRGQQYRAASNGCRTVNIKAYTIIVPIAHINANLNAAQIQGVKNVVKRIRALAKAAGNNRKLYINGHGDVRATCPDKSGTACPGPAIRALIKSGAFEP
ncbi:MAG TPA: hypothetical protein DCE42_01930 [Myxococcales bacterium]|nr:hypothetical protein [Deltaproteobacteria bacterium]MBU47931.1 hypothetical protein [Deltaproteobacteria bacterium]HAA53482.1 hypothetical protein [Myxococcales bacterium]